MRLRLRAVPLIAAVAVLAACGGDDSKELTVFAASSLKPAFENYEHVRLSFGGSDQLAAQIRSGARPDVYAAANAELPQKLHEEGLVERPVRFASNRLVVAVRRDGPLRSFTDVRRVSIGAPSVPIGIYTRDVVRRFDLDVASEEPDVSSIVARVRAGAVDAGIVYATDVRAVPELRAIELPVRTRAEYAAAVVEGTDREEEARRFVQDLRGADALREAGFGP